MERVSVIFRLIDLIKKKKVLGFVWGFFWGGVGWFRFCFVLFCLFLDFFFCFLFWVLGYGFFVYYKSIGRENIQILN